MPLLYRVADQLRHAYWFVVRPHTRGVKCVIEHKDNWLLIRNTYGHRHWTFPGGRIKRNEQPLSAVRREVLEEVGIALDTFEYIGSYKSTKRHRQDTVFCFASPVIDNRHHVDGREVAEARWFPRSAMPDPHSRAVDRIIFMLSTGTHGP
jgi:8-oxo-dGTP pyrophosphatase MutT (NUDIX family)